MIATLLYDHTNLTCIDDILLGDCYDGNTLAFYLCVCFDGNTWAMSILPVCVMMVALLYDHTNQTSIEDILLEVFLMLATSCITTPT